MDVRDFLFQLRLFFPLDRRVEDIEKIFDGYTNDILYEINKEHWKCFNCNFDILLRVIRTNYNFKEFPTVANIIKYIPEAMIRKKLSYSGEEGKVIKRKFGDFEYEFTVVPNQWDKVKTISELDQEITERLKKEKA